MAVDAQMSDEKATNQAPPPTTKTESAAQAVATMLAIRITIAILARIIHEGS